MSVSKETLRQMIQDVGGPDLSDEELDQVMAQYQVHELESERLRQLDLSKVLPARLARAERGGSEP